VDAACVPALRRCEARISSVVPSREAAAILEIDRKTLYRKLEEPEPDDPEPAQQEKPERSTRASPGAEKLW